MQARRYVDTSAFIAFLDRSDSYHPTYRRLFMDPPALATSALTIAEGHGWFLRLYDSRRAIEFLKAKVSTKEAVPHLKKDIDAGKDVEKSVRLLMKIQDPSVPPILAKVLVKHVKKKTFTRDVLVELLGMEELVDKSCLADLKAFADATESDKLRGHVRELIESLENEE